MPKDFTSETARLARPEAPPNLQHGLTFKAYMLCRRCAVRGACDRYSAEGECRVEVDYVAERLPVLMGLPGVDPVADRPLAERTVWYEVLQGRALRWLSLTGGFRVRGDKVEAEPALTTFLSIGGAHDRAWASLGASPASRARLKADAQGGPAAEWAAAVRLVSQEQAAARALPAKVEEGEDSDGDG